MLLDCEPRLHNHALAASQLRLQYRQSLPVSCGAAKPTAGSGRCAFVRDPRGESCRMLFGRYMGNRLNNLLESRPYD
jgi:hypothetical protein